MSVPDRPVPHPNSYWLPGERILAGEYPGAKDRAEAVAKLRRLLEAGVDSFIDLTGPGELSPYETLLREDLERSHEQIHYRRIPVRDLNVPDAATMREILDLIEHEHAHGRTVYLHCWGGVGRTGTVVGCYLVRRGLSGEAALDQLERLWKTVAKRPVHPRSPETDQQRQFVLSWTERHAYQAGRPRLGPDGTRRWRRFYRGCLLGGAVGDALGAPVEFLSLAAIRVRYGAHGILEPTEAYGRVGAITDDTQMTLFTAEGLLRAACRARHKGICSVPGVVHYAYLRWLYTQGGKWDPVNGKLDGWLVAVPELHSARAPGNTCLGALRSGRAGSLERPCNDSKGCGGVMRAAPAGLVGEPDPFRLGCEIAAITHGHPSGYLAAGCLSDMVAEIIAGRSLTEAVEHAMTVLARYPRHEECTRALERALRAARKGPSADQVERLGQGWVAEEALAIGVYCALAGGDDFAAGTRLAVNHSGDSDSTGAIAGNLLGALLGVSAIPPSWLELLELREEIQTLADDLFTLFRPDQEWWTRYPGW
jgi:ADP-ribosyl-[dinitrogen reductase] hydrolase